MPNQNHGETSEKVMGGTIIKTAYGKDDSDVVNSKAAERGGNMGGGINNLSHTFADGDEKANQKGS